MLWMACFVGVVFMTWYISTRQTGRVKAIKTEFVKGRVAP
jgi:hypothetical protein